MFPSTTARRSAALLGSLNSFVFDFGARQKISGASLPYFTMKQITILPPDAYSDANLAFLVPPILELSTREEDLRGIRPRLRLGWSTLRWDEERRFLLRCELDAAFFHLHLSAAANGDWRPAANSMAALRRDARAAREPQAPLPTPRAAVTYILDTFPGVRREDEANHSEYRTKHTILDIYDAMQASIAAGEPTGPGWPHRPPTRAAATHPAQLTCPIATG